ncbi:MAG TPA: lysophospholipid acyltransferase family protein [Geobacteraceae bacterium]|nr:lysophospholipid acyltransferase family protein [Geobacteraceae bacterium]
MLHKEYFQRSSTLSYSRPSRKAFINSLKWGAGICASLPLALFAILIPTVLNRPVGRTLGILVFHLFPRERKRSIKNITESMPSLQRGTSWQRAGGTPYSIAREAFANIGISCIELVKLYSGKGERIINSVAISGVENYLQAQTLGKGVILISGHCGNWELMGMTVCRHLAPLSVVARRQPNELFNNFIEKLRNRYGGNVIYNKGAAKKIFFALRKKEIVGIIIDQVVDPSEGEIVKFLGRRAWMTTAPSAVAEKTGSPIVPFFIHRENGGHRVTISPPIYPENYTSASDITRKLNAEIEEYICNHPDEWLWMYNRWKGIPHNVN